MMHRHQAFNKHLRPLVAPVYASFPSEATASTQSYHNGRFHLKAYDGNRLLRNADLSNLSESGRRIEQISEDITRHRSPISKADCLIIHVSTNNLQRDNFDQVKGCRMGRSDKVSLWYVPLLIYTRFRFFLF